MKPDWKGIFFVAPTQIAEDESIDYEATQRTVENMIKAGAHGIIMLGRYGEVIAMRADEKRRVLAAAKEVVNNRVPLLSGAIETNMDELVSYARDLEAMGVDGLMATTLLGYPPREHEGREFVRRLAASSGLPIMIYNEPHGFGLDFTPALLNELRDVPQLVSIKEATSDTRRIIEIAQQCGDRYLTFCGQDDIAYESLVLGAVGWVCATGSPFPRETVILYDLIKQKRFAEALRLYEWMYPVLALDRRSTFVQCGKLANAIFGQGTEFVRMPLRPLAGAEREEVIPIIEKALAERPSLPILEQAAA